MEELKNMTDQELAVRIIGYVERIEKLMDDVSPVFRGGSGIETHQINRIRYEYKSLKEEIKADARYVYLVRNKKRGNNLYNAFFTPSVREASAYGFRSATNSKINQPFFSSLEEARYRLTKYYSFNKWKVIAEDTRL